MSKNLFITGTGTDVGKTFVAALIVKKLNDDGKKAAYYKAAMSGNERNADGNLIPGDALYVKTVSGIDQPLEQMCPYVYEQAVSPHLASRMEGNPVRLERVVQDFKSVCKTQDYVTMEGSGGILCPLCAEGTPLQLEDVIRELNLGCLLVATAGLGAINAVGLTAEYMRAHKIPLRGIIFNHFHPGNLLEEDNKRMCEEMTGQKVLACVQDGDTELNLQAALLESLYEESEGGSLE